MAALLTGIYAVHLLFAALWTGSVVFVTTSVLPIAVAGDVSPGPLSAMVGKLTTISRASAGALLLTGGHLAATQYGTAQLTGSVRGYAVIAMVVLWFVLAGLVEVGSSKLQDAFDDESDGAAGARPFFLGATGVAVLLLLDAGYLVSV